MKKIILILIFATVSFVNAQVIIGDAVGTATTKTSVLLEFANTNNKGIIVPYVRSFPKNAALVGGSIILDARTPTSARMRFYNGTTWVDLSGRDADVSSYMTIQPTMTAAATSHVIIGDPASTADGVLVLDSATKAMVLPIVTDVNNIPSPSPGMMVYVKGTVNKVLAFYNGTTWSFWKS